MPKDGAPLAASSWNIHRRAGLNDTLEDVGGVDLVFDVLGGDIAKRSARVYSQPEERW